LIVSGLVVPNLSPAGEPQLAATVLLVAALDYSIAAAIAAYSVKKLWIGAAPTDIVDALRHNPTVVMPGHVEPGTVARTPHNDHAPNE